ncbi:protein-disulfide reductase DsbD [Pusillimonas sp. NJUB218]|uniref:protein-disulfide reductase DsbD n=1 Tax=Pusillimonas sp. NJUB218 TaxID=2023230 RepID=UPI000F4C7734|nr:protein-disulfide reductase DsbD [Pusillimonas sp. NJUB218]ROT44277.1 thiol:disulfide interchange protein [Pusillimonas sp. NJUB218]
MRFLIAMLVLALAWLPGVSSAQFSEMPAESTGITESVSASSDSGILGPMRSWFGGENSDQELLPPDEAFKVSVRARDADTLVATLTAADGYYLYRDRIAFALQASSSAAIKNVALPQGKLKDDPTFGHVEVYYGSVQIPITLNRLSGSISDPLILQASYQGCNDPTGVCYPPINKTLSVVLVEAAQTSAASEGANVAQAQASSGIPRSTAKVQVSEKSLVRDLFAQDNAWALIATFFGFGLVLAFTPCMLPMIPILSGMIIGQGRSLSRRHAFGLSLVYVMAMAITYALAGVAAGLAGTMLSAYLQNPWVLGSFALIFVLLALSMFGFYQLQIPASIQSRLAGAANRSAGGKVLSVSVMGVLSAVIVGPCVAAPLAGALLYIGQTGDVVLGGLALFSLAIGMGVPLLIFGTTAGALLPKAGSWMKSVQHFFGVTMLAVAIYLISPVIPSVVHMSLWAALLIISAMYLKALDPLPDGSAGFVRLGKGVGVIALSSGLALLIGVLSGGRDVLQPLRSLSGPGAAAMQDIGSTELQFKKVTSLADLESQLQGAEGRYVMLDFWADWCISCKEMERFTFTDAQVRKRLRDVVLLKADVTANDAEDQALLKRFGLFGPPGIIFFDRQGAEIDFQVIGFQAPQKFLRSLDSVMPGQ